MDFAPSHLPAIAAAAFLGPLLICWLSAFFNSDIVRKLLGRPTQKEARAVKRAERVARIAAKRTSQPESEPETVPCRSPFDLKDILGRDLSERLEKHANLDYEAILDLLVKFVTEGLDRAEGKAKARNLEPTGPWDQRIDDCLNEQDVERLERLRDRTAKPYEEIGAALIRSGLDRMLRPIPELTADLQPIDLALLIERNSLITPGRCIPQGR